MRSCFFFLRWRIDKALVLVLTNLEKLFEVKTNASKHAPNMILMEEGRTIACNSKLQPQPFQH